MCTLHIRHLGGQNPTSVQSRVPSLLLPQILNQSHPMYSIYAPRQPFPSQGNNECIRSISVTWGAKIPLPCNLKFPTSHHLKYWINLTPHTLLSPPQGVSIPDQ